MSEKRKKYRELEWDVPPEESNKVERWNIVFMKSFDLWVFMFFTSLLVGGTLAGFVGYVIWTAFDLPDVVLIVIIAVIFCPPPLLLFSSWGISKFTEEATAMVESSKITILFKVQGKPCIVINNQIKKVKFSRYGGSRFSRHGDGVHRFPEVNTYKLYFLDKSKPFTFSTIAVPYHLQPSNRAFYDELKRRFGKDKKKI